MQKKAPDTPKPVPAAIDFSAYQISNPEEFGRNIMLLLEEGTQALSGFLERSNGKVGPLSTASEITDAAKLFVEVAQSWVSDPAKLAETQGELVRDYLQLAGATSQRLMGA